MNKTCLLNLLGSVDAFVIPTIQRDYAQGRNKGSNKQLCEDVRKGIINALYNALINNEELILDYIYGTNTTNVFYPIDGQQRLTTLFLLHWYIGKKEGVDKANSTDFDVLNKYAYKIRDTSEEFCKALLQMSIDFKSDCISSQIMNSPKYHECYSLDPTVSSMLIVLDSIHDVFHAVTMPLWDRLNNIQFWCLKLEDFGLTDDLFVKMNARGKRLSRFDVFKSDLESKIDKIVVKSAELVALSDKWKSEIDNSYLDLFWEKFEFDYSEINIFRTILFFVKCYIVAEDNSVQYDDSWEIDESSAKYDDVILQIKNKPEVLGKVCNLLSNFESWKDCEYISELFIDKTTQEAKNTAFFKKVILFGQMYWFSFNDGMILDSSYYEFNRILSNYVFSERQANIKPRNYSSSIDNSTFGKSISFLKELIDGYSNRAISFSEYVMSTTCNELEYERNKYIYSNFVEIQSIEELDYIKGNTYNIFYKNGSSYELILKKNEIQDIFSNPCLINKVLRIIFSFADDKYGLFQNLLFDGITAQSGKKQLYYKDDQDKSTASFHKFFFDKNAEFGDRNLTAIGTNQYEDIATCVKKTFESINNKVYKQGKKLSDAVDELLAEKIALCDFSNHLNIKWYIVKYGEFFFEEIGTSLSLLRRKVYGGIDEDNIYDIQCLNITDNDFNMEHYQPFYLAVCHRLNNKITIDENILKYTGVHIEYKHPCVLSNNWILKIDSMGNWVINFNGSVPATPIPGITINASKNGIVDCSGKDSIDTIVSILNAI